MVVRPRPTMTLNCGSPARMTAWGVFKYFNLLPLIWHLEMPLR
jgi:hypothetical protein